MKLYKLFIFAAMIFTELTAMTQTGAAQKTKQNRNWVEFTGHQTVSFGENMTPANFTCESSGIYATANFAAPVDLADGFYVTMATGGKVLVQVKMTVDNAPDSTRSIPVDIVPDDDAELGFPAASLDYSHALLTELKSGKHNITVAVSVGEGSGEQIAAGNFTFDNRRGCAERFERVATLINGTGTAEVEAGEPEVEQVEDDADAPPMRPQTQQPTKSQGNNRNYIEFVNNCSDDQMVTYEQPDGTSSVLSISPGYSRSNDFPVGTQFYRGNGRHGSPFFRLGASQYVNEMDKSRSAQKIQLCR